MGFDNRNPLRQETFALSAHPIPASAGSFNPKCQRALGTSIENADVVHRVEHLRTTPAAIRFISFEPLIGPVGLIHLADIHWAIVGGESGNAARPIREEWIDEIHGQCIGARTAFFFKQWGTWGKDNKRRSKKANGREYRGQTWDEMPVAPQGATAML